MKKLKWDFERGTNNWCDEYTSKDFRISVYPVDNRKNEYELEYQQHKIKRFKKLSVAKKVAQLINNG